jgi:peptidoglycan hydrolase-like protein with peptidoglycan-binding domain
MRRAILTTVSVLALGLGGAGLSYAQGDVSGYSKSGGTATPSLSGTAHPGTAGGTATPSMSGTTQPGTAGGSGLPSGAATPPSGYAGNAAAQSTMPPMSGTSRRGASGQTGMRGEILEAQQKLQQDNLYHSAIDRRLGPETKAALREFQKQNGLRVTASLDRDTRGALLGTGPMGQGSTTPPRPNTSMTPSTTPAPTHSGTSK